jgi:hypothetical protein
MPTIHPIRSKFFIVFATLATIAVIVLAGTCLVGQLFSPQTAPTVGPFGAHVVVEKGNAHTFTLELIKEGYFEPGKKLTTEENSAVLITLPDQSRIRMGSNSSLQYGRDIQQGPNGLLVDFIMDAGKVWVYLNGDAIEMVTPVGRALLTGLMMDVEVDADGITTVNCIRGTCTLSADRGSLDLVGGQSATIASISGQPLLNSSWNLNQIDPAWENIVPRPTLDAMIRSLLATGIAPTFTPTPNVLPDNFSPPGPVMVTPTKSKILQSPITPLNTLPAN